MYAACSQLACIKCCTDIDGCEGHRALREEKRRQDEILAGRLMTMALPPKANGPAGLPVALSRRAALMSCRKGSATKAEEEAGLTTTPKMEAATAALAVEREVSAAWAR